ncbi:ATP synthase subunit I [Clostridium sp. MT-14]|jgi:ATP synthase protein I|uniref:ATP synthase subunit I n=1 Tax=Clostridium aromativorans TaxID=2836848 RepID=A0ABS8N1J7_9CLOT|nr:MULTISPECIES: ATP synthase subunit I [Clostridium]KAA8671775.1 ATP synthase subunit I [Clostridium sp. HV4-5-A1G]MCC9293667.1 ATP synthase subunit I [Clostridium aromativorans]CAB1253993.1 F1Fo ATPase subunit I [Clostridiaceae bacterium BL-3]
MDKHILSMVKKVSIINLIFIVAMACLIQLIFKNYGLFTLIGMLVAIFNFFINAVVGGFVFQKLPNSSSSLYIIGFIMRIVIAAGIGYVIFSYNKNNTIAYLFGYTSHLLGVYIYSVIESNKNNIE